MDESVGKSTDVGLLGSPAGDENAVRRAVHDLGSHDFESRAIARTFILSAGQASVPVLMKELKAERKRGRSVAQRVALLVAVVVLTGPLVGMFFEAAWLVPASNIAACLVLLFACLLFTRPPWYHEAAKLLSKYDGHEVTCAMIESLTDVWGEEQPRLRAAIIHRLAKVTARDADWLQGEVRDRVIALVSMPNWSNPTCVDHVLIIARALAKVGAVEALPVLKGVNAGSVEGERRQRLESGLKEVIVQLEELAAARRQSDVLLRPPDADAMALVRASEGGGEAVGTLLKTPVDTDPQQK